MKTTLSFITLSLLAGFFLAGCGSKYQFETAQKLEKKGFFVEAALKYEEVYKKDPKFERSPEALYRVAEIYRKKLKLYSHAHRYFQELKEKYPNQKPWQELAAKGLLNSPNYFPLTKGSFWIEGDSATGGRNMRSEWNCIEVSTGVFNVKRRLFAGANLVTEISRYFQSSGSELKESTTQIFENPSVVLSYPFIQGRSWQTVRDGKTVICTVEAERVAVNVKAGDFSSCMKISEISPDFKGSRKYIYYAPEVGWILTTVASASGEEHRNTELLSYKINPEN